ncbi:MAG TPA: ferritin-like domain-containing protein [Polyangiaceae bacterium]|nr:ferritin-like domain-containing protein [Polyangiaceae bacterium]
MPLRELNIKQTNEILNAILEHELAGVVRYTHYALMVIGPNRIPIVQFMNAQAQESLLHAQQAGELLTGLEGHPSMRIAPIVETNEHSIKALLQESWKHELEGVEAYKKLLDVVEGASVYLEEYTRGMIGQEERHQIELKKMLRDYGQD